MLNDGRGAFACPDFGGVPSAKPSPRAKTGGGEQLAIPAKTWALIREAAKLHWRDPGDWTAEALANAARQQVHKHKTRAAPRLIE